jgi:hypothetical protein
MQLEYIKALFISNKEVGLKHRYITNNHIEPLLKKLEKHIKIETIGYSVLKLPIYGLQIGTGHKKILMWSQMHGNESTTTKAIFDLINTLLTNNSSISHILQSCTIYIIPILNPDGANAYTRVNANQIDLNRDAQNLTQPESVVLRTVFETFQPDFCYNLHGQRTIFSAGNINKPATVSFLAPAQDEACTITPNRKIAMEVISVMNTALQQLIPSQIGVYDDAFNLNCVGDTFQSENVPTLLFEAGHFENDYARDVTREFIYTAYISSLDYISNNEVSGKHYEDYLRIPENEKLFYDVVIKNAKLSEDGFQDMGIMFQEQLVNNEIVFMPKVDKIGDLEQYFGHKIIDANGLEVTDDAGDCVKLGYENVFVIINNQKIPLFSK